MHLGIANKFVAIVAALAACTPALAADIEIERMTSPEVREAIRAGKTAIIVPTGGTEQNGPHMVLGKHNFIVRETARRIAEALGDALVAPVMSYVPEGDIEKREGHMAYAGTISVAPPIFAAVLEQTAESFRAHGFKTIVFLGDSGPNQEPQRIVAAKLSSAWANEGVRVLSPDAYYGANGGTEWLKGEGESEKSIGTHAAIRDTSELLAVYPEGVHPERAVADSEGVVGDPTRASAARGAKLLDLKVAAAVKDIKSRLATVAPAAPPQAESLWRRLKRWILG